LQIKYNQIRISAFFIHANDLDERNRNIEYADAIEPAGTSKEYGCRIDRMEKRARE
jgi:hypothetical protein